MHVWKKTFIVKNIIIAEAIHKIIKCTNLGKKSPQKRIDYHYFVAFIINYFGKAIDMSQ